MVSFLRSSQAIELLINVEVYNKSANQTYTWS